MPKKNSRDDWKQVGSTTYGEGMSWSVEAKGDWYRMRYLEQTWIGSIYYGCEDTVGPRRRAKGMIAWLKAGRDDIRAVQAREAARARWKKQKGA